MIEWYANNTRYEICAASSKRFLGKANLLLKAKYNNICLFHLEWKLGIISYEERCVSSAIMNQIILQKESFKKSLNIAIKLFDNKKISDQVFKETFPLEYDEIISKRKARLSNKVNDEILNRENGIIAKKYLESKLNKINIRKNLHCHQDKIIVVPIGKETSESSIEKILPKHAGLPRAYSKKGYYVSASTHVFKVSTAILSKEVYNLQKNDHDYLYLTTTKRVTNSRGSTLKVENFNGKKWI